MFVQHEVVAAVGSAAGAHAPWAQIGGEDGMEVPVSGPTLTDFDIAKNGEAWAVHGEGGVDGRELQLRVDALSALEVACDLEALGLEVKVEVVGANGLVAHAGHVAADGMVGETHRTLSALEGSVGV